jgi:hypothetical protein
VQHHLRRPLNDHATPTIPPTGPIDTPPGATNSTPFGAERFGWPRLTVPPARKPSDAVTTRFPVEDYALRDSIAARRCDCQSLQPRERHDAQRTHHVPCRRSGKTRRGSRRATLVPRLRRPDRYRRTHDQDPRRSGPHALRSVSAAVGAAMTSPPRDSTRRSRLNRHEPRVRESPNVWMTAQVVLGSTQRSGRLWGAA